MKMDAQQLRELIQYDDERNSRLEPDQNGLEMKLARSLIAQ
jgi:hypothetical protein